MNIWQRVRHWLHPSNIRLEGGCHQCGTCCRNVLLFIEGSVIKTEEEYHALIKRDQQWSMFKINGSNQEGDLLFICDHISNENTCQIYAKRPAYCKEYPTVEMIKRGGRLFSACGYKKAALLPFDVLLKDKLK